MTFEQALKNGDLDVARAILDELPELPGTGDLHMPECYADLARQYDRQGRHDDAIALHQRAIELDWDSIPDPRSDIAEFHLRAGREEQAPAIWAELKASEPDDVWLYNAAGLAYNEVGQQELAVAWLGGGIELAMRTDDPEGIINQLSDVRRHSLRALVEHDEDPEEARAAYAAHLMRDGEAIAWPPGRNESCWRIRAEVQEVLRSGARPADARYAATAARGHRIRLVRPGGPINAR